MDSYSSHAIQDNQARVEQSTQENAQSYLIRRCASSDQVSTSEANVHIEILAALVVVTQTTNEEMDAENGEKSHSVLVTEDLYASQRLIECSIGNEDEGQLSDLSLNDY